MKTSFWGRWYHSLRSAKQTRSVARPRPRRQPLGLEILEDRVTPSLTPQMVLDINPGITSSNLSGMVAIGSTTYFSADDGVNGRELWKSVGTAAGTTLVKDINPGGSSNPSSLTNVNGTLFFLADDGTHGYELWKSDGTAAGTTLVEDIVPGSGHASPRYLTNVNGTLFFTAQESTHGRELWKSDGTAAGTTLVKDINGGSGSYPNNLTNVNGTLYFSASDGARGYELWKSDGTAAGTTLVKDIVSYGLIGSNPGRLTNVNGTLFFTAEDVNGNELWKSDGTAAGTTLVKDIYPGTHLEYDYYGGSLEVANSSNPSSLTNVNGALFFTADDGTHGQELWKSDGTAAGTVRVKDIRPGSNGSYPNALMNVNGTLLFSADDGTHGIELWKSDGTAASTVLVGDIQPGNASSSPTSLINVIGTLFFTADDGIHGRELWKLVDDQTQPSPALSIKDVTVAEGNSGTRSATFTVTLSAASILPVTVQYATANGTATAGSDYQARGGTLSIPAGQTTGTITVPVIGDRLPEPNETFVVNLSGATNATIADGQAVGTIVDDEPHISISDVTKAEGRKSKTSLFTFTVTLSVPYDQPVTMSFQTANDVATTSDGDYVAKSGTLTFNPGETTKTITIDVKGDRKRESNETFYLDLFNNSSNALFTKKRGLGTILNDD
jgi:ELWxxDGT repeat protein